MIPARGKVLVKCIETPETLPHGKIILTEATREELTAYQVEIVAVGKLAYCEDTECERPHVVEHPGFPIDSEWLRGAPQSHAFSGNAGDWVLVAPRSLSDSGEDGLYVVSQDSVLAILTT